MVTAVSPYRDYRHTTVTAAFCAISLAIAFACHLTMHTALLFQQRRPQPFSLTPQKLPSQTLRARPGMHKCGTPTWQNMLHRILSDCTHTSIQNPLPRIPFGTTPQNKPCASSASTGPTRTWRNAAKKLSTMKNRHSANAAKWDASSTVRASPSASISNSQKDVTPTATEHDTVAQDADQTIWYALWNVQPIGKFVVRQDLV